MHTLKLNPKALEDLKAIKSHITEELENPTAASQTILSIIESYERLKDFPSLGGSLSTKIDVKTDYRFLVSGEYIIFYKFDSHYVYIYRILYGKRDYLNILFKENDMLH